MKKNPKSGIDVNHVAKLANLKLTAKEKQELNNKLADILSYVDKLKEVDTAKVEPIGQITGLVNVTREDIAAPSLTQRETLANAPRTHSGFIEVDPIFEDQ